MTTSQLDSLGQLSRRVLVCALAVRTLGTDHEHQVVEELLGDIHDDLSAFVEAASLHA